MQFSSCLRSSAQSCSRGYARCAGVLLLILVSTTVLADHPTVGIPGTLGGPVTTSSAYTLGKGEAAISFDFQYINFDPVSKARLALASDRDEDIHSADAVARTALNLAMGVSDQLTLGVSLPYIERQGLKEAAHGHQDEHEEHAEPPETVSYLGDASGFGDVHLHGAYRFATLAPLAPFDSSASVALLFGLNVPTGDTHEKSHDGERLEAELQPGSGAWSPSLGLAFSTGKGSWSFDSNVLYTLVTEGSQGTDLGDVFNYNLSLSRQIYGLAAVNHDHQQHDHHDAVRGGGLAAAGISTALVLELNGEWRDRADIDGQTQLNSGGNLVYIAPGIRVQSGDWQLSAALSVPIENMNGVQSEPETRLVFRVGRAL